MPRSFERETVSPEREEIERQAEYFELEHRRRRTALGLSFGMIALMTAGAILTILLGGCDLQRGEWFVAQDGSCTLVQYRGGQVDRVIQGLACPDGVSR